MTATESTCDPSAVRHWARQQRIKGEQTRAWCHIIITRHWLVFSHYYGVCIHLFVFVWGWLHIIITATVALIREFSQSTFRSLKDVHPINCSCYTRRILNGLCACEQASPDHSVANGKWTIHGWQTIFRYKSKCDIPKLLDYQWYQKVS